MTTKVPKLKLEVTIKLRLATKEDFRKIIWVEDQYGSQRKIVPKIGQPYWVQSQTTQELDGHYIINEDTNWQEIRAWLSNNMLYVPVRFWDLED